MTIDNLFLTLFQSNEWREEITMMVSCKPYNDWMISNWCFNFFPCLIDWTQVFFFKSCFSYLKICSLVGLLALIIFVPLIYCADLAEYMNVATSNVFGRNMHCNYVEVFFLVKKWFSKLKDIKESIFKKNKISKVLYICVS